MDVPSQDVISRDNVSVKVNAVVYFRVVDPQKAIIQVENFLNATSQLAQTTLRSVLGKHDLDEMLAERERLNTATSRRCSTARPTPGASRSPMSRSSTWISTKPWSERSPGRPRPSANGAPRSSMPRANCRPRKNCCRRPRCWRRQPQAIQLRYLETLTVIGADKNSTIVFPLPMDIVAPLMSALQRSAAA